MLSLTRSFHAVSFIAIVFLISGCGGDSEPVDDEAQPETKEVQTEVKPVETTEAQEPEEPTDELAKSDLKGQVQEILQRACVRCHGDADEGGLADILDVDRLIADELLVRGNAEESDLWLRIEDQEMPPEEPRLTDEETQLVKQWIDEGAENFHEVIDREFVHQDDMFKTMAEFLNETRPRDQSSYRFITLTHLYNANEPKEKLRMYRLGLLKLLNSLSWNEKLAKPEFIDQEQTILAIDLRDIAWNERIWNDILDVYPYRIKQTSTHAETCYAATGTTQPMITGDWFIARASRPPLYHDILQLPETEEGLERLLKVRGTAVDPNGSRIVRAGFLNSGVSDNNRIIERHDIPYGAYWKSYDFVSNTGRKNIMKYPLGPGDDQLHFEHDGGEMIFSLPNGLHAYLLVDGNGDRIDNGPVEVVRNLSKKMEPTISNGLACMSCHFEGTIDKKDEV